MTLNYVVRKVETLQTIAARFHLPVAELKEANPGVNETYMPEGHTIVIPLQLKDMIVRSFEDYSYDDVEMQLEGLRSKYSFLEIESIGQSVLGRNLSAIRLGTGGRYIHFHGSVHANEWITSILLMKFMEDAARAYCSNEDIAGMSASKLFSEFSLWIVPMVNPDGVELVQHGAGTNRRDARMARAIELNGGSEQFSGWKANVNGVDLNDQFPAHWEKEQQRRAVDRPGPRDYTGHAPLTEPEAIALADFTIEQDFECVVSLHTQGEEIYWNYRDMEPELSEVIAERMAAVSGYKAVKLFESDAGFKDWFIEKFRRPGFTVEAGLGVNPLPLGQFDEIYRKVRLILIETLRSLC